jgi:hypothetical protein
MKLLKRIFEGNKPQIHHILRKKRLKLPYLIIEHTKIIRLDIAILNILKDFSWIGYHE